MKFSNLDHKNPFDSNLMYGDLKKKKSVDCELLLDDVHFSLIDEDGVEEFLQSDDILGSIIGKGVDLLERREVSGVIE